MANRYYTIMIIPEKSARTRRMILPSWILKSSLVSLFFVALLGAIMVLDYWYVMNQISENKELKLENRRLRQQVQIFQNKIVSIEDTLNRIETFSTRLKVITNIEDRDSLVQKLNETLPYANQNLPQKAPLQRKRPEDVSFTPPDFDPNDRLFLEEQQKLDDRFGKLNERSLLVEQGVQDLYELLADQKAFLAALPTRWPAFGTPTSGFGIRSSPLSGREKMHEGLDVANHVGTPIVATAYGTIKFSGLKPGYGRTVIVDHGYGLETWYGHAQTLTVRKGDQVRRGQKVALMGNSGRSTGPHVHYEVRANSIPVDPWSYILEN